MVVEQGDANHAAQLRRRQHVRAMGCRPHLERIGGPQPLGALSASSAAVHGQHREGALAPVRKRHAHDRRRACAPSSASPTGDAGVTCVRFASPTRRPTSSYSVSLPRLIADAHDGSEPGDAIAGDRGVDDGGGGDESLELGDLHPLDRHVLEHRQVVVVVDGRAEGPRVAQPLGDSARCAPRSDSSSRTASVEVGRAEHHAVRGAASCERSGVGRHVVGHAGTPSRAAAETAMRSRPHLAVRRTPSRSPSVRSAPARSSRARSRRRDDACSRTPASRSELQRDVGPMRTEVLVREHRVRSGAPARVRAAAPWRPRAPTSDVSKQASVGADGGDRAGRVRRRLECLGGRQQPGGVLVELVRGIAPTRSGARSRACAGVAS